MSAAEQSTHGRPSTDVESPPDATIRIGVSTCLLGEHVRFDGGHKRDPFLVETFGRYVEWVPVCPEVEAGLGRPRAVVAHVYTAGGPCAPHPKIRGVRTHERPLTVEEAVWARWGRRAVTVPLYLLLGTLTVPSCR